MRDLHNLLIIKVLFSVLVLLPLTGCFDTPDIIKTPESKSNLLHKENTVVAKVLSDEGGVLTAAVDIASNETTVIGASGASEISGSSLAIAPNTLAIPTEIVVEAGAPMSTQALQDDLGLTEEYAPQAAGAPAIFKPTVEQDPVIPLTIELPSPEGGLSLAGSGSLYIIIQRLQSYKLNKTFVGVLSRDQYRVSRGKFIFSAPYFGEFTIYKVKKEVKAIKAKETSNKIVTKVESVGKPLKVDSVAPLVLAMGEQVVIRGVNFRPSFKIAMNGASISGLKISDTEVKFDFPNSAAYGFHSLKGQQEDSTVEFKLFAQADRKAYPIITLENSGVCEGVRYYDAAGNEQVGTKSCAPKTTTVETKNITGAVTSVSGHGLGSLATKNKIQLSDLAQQMCSANQVIKMNSAGTALECADMTSSSASGGFENHASNYTVVVEDKGKILSGSGVNFTLPAAADAGNGFSIGFKRVGGDIGIIPDGTDTIDGTNRTAVLYSTSTFTEIMSDGSSWHSISGTSFGCRHFKLVITSLTGTGDSSVLVGIKDFRLKWGGSLQTNSYSTYSGTTGGYNASISYYNYYQNPPYNALDGTSSYYDLYVEYYSNLTAPSYDVSTNAYGNYIGLTFEVPPPQPTGYYVDTAPAQADYYSSYDLVEMDGYKMQRSCDGGSNWEDIPNSSGTASTVGGITVDF